MDDLLTKAKVSEEQAECDAKNVTNGGGGFVRVEVGPKDRRQDQGEELNDQEVHLMGIHVTLNKSSKISERDEIASIDSN